MTPPPSITGALRSTFVRFHGHEGRKLHRRANGAISRTLCSKTIMREMKYSTVLLLEIMQVFDIHVGEKIKDRARHWHLHLEGSCWLRRFQSGEQIQKSCSPPKGSTLSASLVARIRELPEYKVGKTWCQVVASIARFFPDPLSLIFILCRCMKIFRSSTRNCRPPLFPYLHSSCRDSDSPGRAIIITARRHGVRGRARIGRTRIEFIFEGNLEERICKPSRLFATL